MNEFIFDEGYCTATNDDVMRMLMMVFSEMRTSKSIRALSYVVLKEGYTHHI